MLTYQPQNDIYNGIFRILSILMYDTSRAYPLDLLRILDFYYVFPNFINEIRLPSTIIKYREFFKKLNKNTYFPQGNKRQIFYQLTKIQNESFNTLVSRNILDRGSFEKEIIRLNDDVDIAPFLCEQIYYRNEENKDIIDFLVNKLSKITFWGKDGLKARSGLMEYRYDIV